MPTYDYECDACGHKLEIFQNISDDPLTKCPACKKKKLRRLFGAGAGILFKGSGFYKTDYRSDAYKQKAASDKSTAGSSTESSSTGGAASTGGNTSTGDSKASGTSGGAGGKGGQSTGGSSGGSPKKSE